MRLGCALAIPVSRASGARRSRRARECA